MWLDRLPFLRRRQFTRREGEVETGPKDPGQSHHHIQGRTPRALPQYTGSLGCPTLSRSLHPAHQAARKHSQPPNMMVGGFGVGVTLVPIPNTTVKPHSADGTAGPPVGEYVAASLRLPNPPCPPLGPGGFAIYTGLGRRRLKLPWTSAPTIRGSRAPGAHAPSRRDPLLASRR